MAGLTAEDLREKTKKDLELARERVRLLEEQLKWIEDVINKNGEETPEHSSTGNGENETEEQSLLAPTKSSGEDSPGRAIRELMENAPGEFNVPGVVNAILKEFPDYDYKALSKKGSQIANRLSRMKKIKLISRGTGREPNVYVSTKYTGTK